MPVRTRQFVFKKQACTSHPTGSLIRLRDVEGCQADAVYAQYPPYRDDPNLNQFDRHFVQKAPGGENLREVTERAWAFIERLDNQSGVSWFFRAVANCSTAVAQAIAPFGQKTVCGSTGLSSAST